MAGWGDVVPALVSGGLGASLGAVGVALVQTFGRKAESRATAADLIAQAAGGLADRQAATINRLEQQLQRQRRAVIALTSVVEDDLLPKIQLDPGERDRLRKALTAVKLAV